MRLKRRLNRWYQMGWDHGLAGVGTDRAISNRYWRMAYIAGWTDGVIWKEHHPT